MRTTVLVTVPMAATSANISKTYSEAPVIRLVNTIIGRVIDLRASDIHLEPLTTDCMCVTALTV